MNCLDSLSVSSMVCNSAAMSAVAAFISAVSAMLMVFITFKIYKWNLKDRIQENELSHYFEYVVVYSMNITDEKRNDLEQLIDDFERLLAESSDVKSLRKKIDEIQSCYGTYKKKLINRLIVFDENLAKRFISFFEKKTDKLTKKLQLLSMSPSTGTLRKTDFLDLFDISTRALKEKSFK